jgi:tripartite-type tricarboxylate transporter receptor subunit TctC
MTSNTRAGLLPAIAALLLGFTLPSLTTAQDAAYPDKPVKIIVPFPPGGAADTFARLAGQKLAEAWANRQQVLIDNRPGAGGIIGTEATVKAAPDGYTMLMVTIGHAVNPFMYAKLPYDTRVDLVPVAVVANVPSLVVVGPGFPGKTLKDLLAAAKATPGLPNYGTIGSGSLANLAMTTMCVQGGFTPTHVPYKGGGPLVQDAIGGHVPVAIGSIALFAPHIKSGVLVPLAVTTTTRDPVLPNVPTVSEQGLPGFEATAWWGILAPAKTPPAIVARMNAEVTKLLRDPQMREKMANQGMNIVASTPEAFGKFIDEQSVKWAKVVKDNNIRAGE